MANISIAITNTTAAVAPDTLVKDIVIFTAVGLAAAAGIVLAVGLLCLCLCYCTYDCCSWCRTCKRVREEKEYVEMRRRRDMLNDDDDDDEAVWTVNI